MIVISCVAKIGLNLLGSEWSCYFVVTGIDETSVRVKRPAGGSKYIQNICDYDTIHVMSTFSFQPKNHASTAQFFTIIRSHQFCISTALELGCKSERKDWFKWPSHCTNWTDFWRLAGLNPRNMHNLSVTDSPVAHDNPLTLVVDCTTDRTSQ